MGNKAPRQRLDANKDRIIQMMADGAYQHTIAREMGVTELTFRNWLKVRGMTWQPQPVIRGVASCDSTIRDMAKCGHAASRIAEELGFSVPAIRRYCRDHSIRLPKVTRRSGPVTVKAQRDSSEIGQAIDFMRRFYIPVYRAKTAGANDDRIICGNLKLSPAAFMKKARSVGYRVS